MFAEHIDIDTDALLVFESSETREDIFAKFIVRDAKGWWEGRGPNQSYIAPLRDFSRVVVSGVLTGEECILLVKPNREAWLYYLATQQAERIGRWFEVSPEYDGDKTVDVATGRVFTVIPL